MVQYQANSHTDTRILKLALYFVSRVPFSKAHVFYTKDPMTLKFEIFGLENIEMGHLCIKDLVSHSLQIVFGLTEIGAR